MKAVVVLSGGQDSATALALAVRHPEMVDGVTSGSAGSQRMLAVSGSAAV